MFACVVDTHAAIWFFSGDPRLSEAAKNALFAAASSRRKVAVSSVSLAELVYLVEKQRLPFAAYDDLRRALADPNHVLGEVPFNSDVVEAMRQVSREEIPDMPDRIIAATAVYLGVPVVSRDGRIRTSSVRSIW